VKTPGRSHQLRTGLKVFIMVKIRQDGAQHNVAWTILPALLIPETGCALHTIAAKGAVKILAHVDMRPGDGLSPHARAVATAAPHDICQVYAHADIPSLADELPGPCHFHVPTLFWALENAEQIALWCELGTSRHSEVAAWTVNTAHAGSRFQTVINATPDNADEWLAFITRWKSPNAELRVFGGETVQ